MSKSSMSHFAVFCAPAYTNSLFKWLESSVLNFSFLRKNNFKQPIFLLVFFSYNIMIMFLY